jgi:AraC-like DNA-binding protein
MRDDLDKSLLPVERTLHSGDLVFIGSFRCPQSETFFRDSGPARNHIFVFPRTTVGIQHEGDDLFVSSPMTVNFYNRGDAYTRKKIVPGMGDRCEFFAVAPSAIASVKSGIDPDKPFASRWARLSPEMFVRQRSLIRALETSAIDGMAVEESVLLMLGELLNSDCEKKPISRSSRERVEYAKTLLAAQIDEQVSLQQIASQTHTSVYHLCKVFRAHTSSTMSEFRLKLRLRQAYDEVASSDDILATALRLGFSSHSYFTYAFRTEFGVTPSAVRHRLR